MAFGELLKSGDELARAFTDASGQGLVSIATDAETFGHHHKFSEMALAFALDNLGSAVTTYGAWLRDNPLAWANCSAASKSGSGIEMAVFMI